jgi:hypothetical protein
MERYSLHKVVTLATSYASNESLLYLDIFTKEFRDDVSTHTKPDGNEQAFWILLDKSVNHYAIFFSVT